MSQFYPTGLTAILDAFFGNDGPGFVVQLYACGISSAYVYDATHSTGADLGDNLVAQATEITNSGIVDGTVGGDNITFRGLTQGDVIDRLVIFAGWNDGMSDLSQLLCLLDSASVPELPLTCQGDVANVAWNAAGIFKIG